MAASAAPKKPKRPKTDGGGQSEFADVVGLPTSSASALIHQIAKGLPFKAWEKFLAAAGLTVEEGSRAVQIPIRTVNRRRAEGRLHPDESDRLVRSARLFHLILQLFEGDAELARRWFVAPQQALGGASPMEYGVTDVGAREVETLVGRLEHGIPV